MWSVVNCMKVKSSFRSNYPSYFDYILHLAKKLPNRSFDLIMSIFSTLANHTMQICINCFKYKSKPLMTLASIHNHEVFIYSFFQKRRVVVLSVDHIKIPTSYFSPSLLQIKYPYSDMKSLYIKTLYLSWCLKANSASFTVMLQNCKRRLSIL